jgi:two-component system phosphate regulon sensor histidine kinase PhoR
MDELKEGEKAGVKVLLKLNEELENYFRNTIIPQLFIDANLILRKFSPPANMHFALTAANIGKSIYDVPNLASLPGLIDAIKAVVANNEDIEQEIQTEDKRWFQMNVLPYIIKKKNTTNGAVITFIDITERIADKQAIEKINADHETFIYSVSHDFRGPITNMLLLLELLRSAVTKNDTKDIKQLLDVMDRAAQSMKTMINELTDITRIGTHPEDQMEIVDVEQILGEVKFSLKSQIYQSHAKITTNIQVEEVQFSKKNLRSILYNLLCNAIKFTVPGKTPEIFINTEDREEYTLLSVRDNGVGIEEERKKDIFSKFTRLQPQIEGMGIGLFIVDKMVVNQGGKIEVESTVNSGTTFKIYLKNQ